MGMFGARFAVFVRRARVLPGPCPATRNLSFLRFHRRRHFVVSTRCFTGLLRVAFVQELNEGHTNFNGTLASERRRNCDDDDHDCKDKAERIPGELRKKDGMKAL